MKSLLYLQIVSFISRLIAMFSGIIQSLVIVNLLSTKEYGIIGLVASIAGIAGITQHLGLAASSTKEISQAKDGNEIFHIVLASLGIRFFISFPVAFVLFFFAPQIASFYSNNELIFPLQVFGGITLVQAFQSIFNSVISGNQRFKQLFTYQVLVSFVSVLIFIPLVYSYKLNGYFYALISFNIVQTLALSIIAFRGLKFDFKLPSRKLFFEMVIKLLKISLVIYFVKIIFTAWQEVPIVLLGKLYPIEVLALFTFAFNLSSKLMTISDSVTDVNLPVYSKKSTEDTGEFFKLFVHNYNIIFYFVTLVGISVAFWSKEILQLSDTFIFYLGMFLGHPLEKNIYIRYQSSLIYFLPLIISMIFYSFINIFKSSIMVPLERLKHLSIAYTLLFLVTFGSFYTLKNFIESLYSMSISLAFGAFFCFLYLVLEVKKKFEVNLFETKKILFTSISIFMVLIAGLYLNDLLISKILVYLFYIFLILSVFKLNILALIKRKS